MQAVLVMFRSDGERRSFSVTRDMTVIGRREDCDLRIPLGDISRKHARLVRDGDILRLEDLGSSNGTFLNGQRVQEAVLNPGDSVQIGPVVFVLQIDGYPADEELHPVVAEAADHAVPEPMAPDTGPLSPTAQSEIDDYGQLEPLPPMEEDIGAAYAPLPPVSEESHHDLAHAVEAEPEMELMPEVEEPKKAKTKLAAKAPPLAPAPPRIVDNSPIELEPSPHPDVAGDVFGSLGHEDEMELLPEIEEAPAAKIPPLPPPLPPLASQPPAPPPTNDADFELETLPELADDEALELLPDEPVHLGHDEAIDLDFGLDSQAHPHA